MTPRSLQVYPENVARDADQQPEKPDLTDPKLRIEIPFDSADFAPEPGERLPYSGPLMIGGEPWWPNGKPDVPADEPPADES